jgi:hypothetical protein
MSYFPRVAENMLNSNYLSEEGSVRLEFSVSFDFVTESAPTKSVLLTKDLDFEGLLSLYTSAFIGKYLVLLMATSLKIQAGIKME